MLCLVYISYLVFVSGDRIQSPKRCVLNRNRTLDNVQKHINCTKSCPMDLKMRYFRRYTLINCKGMRQASSVRSFSSNLS
jgi:hypothetical protein